jgi:RNA polymerase sigma-70 factor (ECF subfamily)
MLTPDTDLALTEKARAGDRCAFGALYERYYHRVKRQASRYVTGAQRDDLIHDVFVKAIERLPQAREGTDFLNWVLRITDNVCLDHLRKASTRQEKFVGLPTDDYDVGEPEGLLFQADETPIDGALLSWERAQLIEELLGRLRPDDAATIRMQAEGYSLRQIAARLVTPWTALKPRMFRVRANLATEMLENQERYGPLDTGRAARSLGSKLSAYHRKRGRQPDASLRLPGEGEPGD